MIIIALITYTLSIVSEKGRPHSVAVRDNKLITIYREFNSNNIKVKVFELKEGATIDIFKNGKTFDYGRIDTEFGLIFMDIPYNVEDDKNKIWLKSESFQTFNYVQTNSPFMNWMGSINLDDMSLENQSNFIRFPTHERFPIKGYTINKIVNVFGSALYITGGVLYSKMYNRAFIESSFFKYNFSTREWVDMNYLENGKLKPLFGHSSVVIENRYLIILGGFGVNSEDSPESISNKRSTIQYNSLYNLTVFDTYTNNWENVKVKPNKFENGVTTIQFDRCLATVHNDKIIVLGGYTGEGGSGDFQYNNYYGILDFKSKSWSWSPILNEDGTNYISHREIKVSTLFNDQLIIFTVYDTEVNETPILVFDIPSKMIKSTLKLANLSNTEDFENGENETQNQYKNIPTYAIVLIALCCTALLLVFIYLLLHKIKKNSSSKNGKIKYKGPIREVWSNPDIYNTNNIIMWDKKKGLSIKQNNSNTLYTDGLFPKLENQNTSNMIEIS